MKARAGFAIVEVLFAVMIVCAVLGLVAALRAGGHRALVQVEDVSRLQADAHRLASAAALLDFEELLAAAPGGAGELPGTWISGALGAPAPGLRAWTERTGDPDVLRLRVEARVTASGRRLQPVVRVMRLVVRADASLWRAMAMEGGR